jgi:hypothetical protein
MAIGRVLERARGVSRRLHAVCEVGGAPCRCGRRCRGPRPPAAHTCNAAPPPPPRAAAGRPPLQLFRLGGPGWRLLGDGNLYEQVVVRASAPSARLVGRDHLGNRWVRARWEVAVVAALPAAVAERPPPCPPPPRPHHLRAATLRTRRRRSCATALWCTATRSTTHPTQCRPSGGGAAASGTACMQRLLLCGPPAEPAGRALR